MTPAGINVLITVFPEGAVIDGTGRAEAVFVPWESHGREYGSPLNYLVRAARLARRASCNGTRHCVKPSPSGVEESRDMKVPREIPIQSTLESSGRTPT